MKWINKIIINKSVKLPWLEVHNSQKDTASYNDFHSFLYRNNEFPPRSSLHEALHGYASQDDLESSSENTAQVRENIPFGEPEFSPISKINFSSSITERENQNIADYHYSKFQVMESSQNYQENRKTVMTSSNSADQMNYTIDNKKEYTHLIIHESEKLAEKPAEPISSLLSKSMEHNRIIPRQEEFLLNPVSADQFQSPENHLLEPGFDHYDTHDVNEGDDNDNIKALVDELTEEEIEENEINPDSFLKPTAARENTESLLPQTSEESLHNKHTFRCSITPEVHTSDQFRIPFDILKTGSDSFDHTDPVEVQQVIEKLESTLEQFGIEARVIGMQKGPIITRYELRIPPGIKVNRILSLTDELAMALEALRVRIEAPIPGRSTVGIEIPNKKRSTVLLGDILNHPEYNGNNTRLPLPLGKDIAGNLLIEDLARMPHILIAGATGSGKSVAINSFITSLIITKSPEDVRMLMVDPKLVELSQYNDIPHLLHPVIADPQKAILALNWAVEEMERRYEDMADMRSRDIVSYNLKVEQQNKKLRTSDEIMPKMPYIIVLIDELGDLMMVAGKEVESSIIRLSQKARAIGIHLILATQRPSVDVITALIKANCPARIALQVAQKTDSRTILDSNGGEQLLGQGDMLFKHPSKAQLIRAQAPYVSDAEVEDVVHTVKKLGKPSYIVLEDPKSKSSELDLEDEDLFEEAWQIIIESNKASASYLQRRLRIGYNRAARLIEAFEARGYIGPQVGSKPREILVPR